MRRRGFLSDCHPLTAFSFFALVLGFTMFFWHPLCLLISLCGALLCRIQLTGAQAAGRSFLLLVPLMAAAAVINPLFNHEGVTILAYLPSGNPLTRESVLFGLAAGVMLGAVVTWFSCCTIVLTTDKLVCLFGRALPALSLLLSMILRFFPQFLAQFRAVDQAQHCLGRGCRDGGPIARLRHAVAVFSILITWSLEHALETADRMKALGYGLRGRTSFSLYRMETRDYAALALFGACGAFLLFGGISGGFYWQYFPTVHGGRTDALTLSLHGVYLALCLAPVILSCWEDRAWNLSQSNR